MKGTWQMTSGGFDPAAVIAPAVFVGAAAGIAAIILALMWWIVSAAALGGAFWLFNLR
jgi:hypothetical protein